MHSAERIPWAGLAPALAALLLIYAAALYMGRADNLRGHRDFAAFYAAGAMVKTGQGAALYDYAAQQRMQQQLGFFQIPLLYVHPPFEALLFAAMALMPYAAAFFLWAFANFLMIAAIPLLLARFLPALERELPIVLLLAGCFPPVVLALRQGQDSILLLFLWTLAFLALKDGHDQFAGVLLALSSFKLQFLPLLLIVLVCERRWKLLGAFAAGAATLAAISTAALGWHAVAGYPAFLQQVDGMPAYLSRWILENMPTVRGVFHVFLGGGSKTTADALYLLVALLLVALVLFLYLRHSTSSGNAFELRFSLIVAVTPLISWHAFLYDFSILVLPLLLVLDYAARAGAAILRLSIAAVLFMFAASLLHFGTVLAFCAFLFFFLITAWNLWAQAPATGQSHFRVDLR